MHYEAPSRFGQIQQKINEISLKKYSWFGQIFWWFDATNVLFDVFFLDEIAC